MADLLLPGVREDNPARVWAGKGLVALLRSQLGVDVRPRWQRGVLALSRAPSVLELEQFLLHRYAPSPIVSPWLKGSGFFGKEGSEVLRRCEEAPAPRFAVLAQAIEEARQILEEKGFREAPPTDAKLAFLDELDTRWSGRRWLAAAFDGVGPRRRPNPQLGTGGNDGRLDYSQAFLRRLEALFELDSNAGVPGPRALRRLRSFLFEEAYPRTSGRWPTGRLDPSESGGLSTTAAALGPPRGSAWSLILTLEGLVEVRTPSKRGNDQAPLRRASLRGGLFGIGGIEARVSSRVRSRGGANAASTRSAIRALVTPFETWRRDLGDAESLRPDLRRAAAALDATLEAAVRDSGSPARLRQALEALARFAFLAPPVGRPRPPFPAIPVGLLKRADDGSLEFRTARALASMRPAADGAELELHWASDPSLHGPGRARGEAADFFSILKQRARWAGHHPTGLVGSAGEGRFLETVRTTVDPARVSRLLPALFRTSGPPPVEREWPGHAGLDPVLSRARQRLLRGEHLRPDHIVRPAEASCPYALGRAALALLLVGDAPR